MKYQPVYFAIAILLLASLACQTFGGSEKTPPANPANDNNTESTVGTDFPMTNDAYNVTEAGGSLIYFTKLSLEDILKFYREEYAAKGYTEREVLTVTSSTTLNMVFDGDPSGKSVVIQSVDLGDGSRTVSLRLEDVQ